MLDALWIARREFRSYFASPIAYIVIAVFLFLIGYMFFNLLGYFQGQVQSFMRMSQGPKPTVTNLIVSPLFGNINVVLLFIIPFITMRLFAEERKEHTAELLLTAPVSPLQIVVGKFLAAYALVSLMILGTTACSLTLIFASNVDKGVLLGCYVGILLVAAAYIAIGLFWSACTENQIVAAAATFGSLLFLWLVAWGAHHAGYFWKEVLEQASIIVHFNSFARGIIDTNDVIYYLVLVGLGVFGAYTTFDANQWGNS